MSYTYTLTSPISNAEGSNSSSFNIPVAAVDSLGLAAQSNISVTVKDDVPVAVPDNTVVLHNPYLESTLHQSEQGHAFLPMSVNGTLANIGADAQGSHVDWTAADLPTGLLSNGNDVSYSISEDGQVLTGYTSVSEGTLITDVFTLTAHADGSYQFEQNADLTFAPTEDDTQTNNLVFSFKATDGDHDASSGQVSVQVNDYTPLAEDGVTDVFKWQLGDFNATQIGGFDFKNAGTKGGDVLDLRDLLQGEHSDAAHGATGSLDSFLSFSEPAIPGGPISMLIKTDGTDNLAKEQTVSFSNYQTRDALAHDLGLAQYTDDSTLLKKLVDTGHIKTDA
ncbi:MAG: type I secretion C-terminal target domain-containing protein [Rhodoferax sp.]|nr:type I secretion C-terminal target domain-containing protein [Rhodoferax sp.]